MAPREPQPLPALKSLSKFEGLKFVMSRALSLSFCFFICGEGRVRGNSQRLFVTRSGAFVLGSLNQSGCKSESLNSTSMVCPEV